MIPAARVSSVSLQTEGSEVRAIYFEQFNLITVKVLYIRNVPFNTKHSYSTSSTVYHVFPIRATETLTFC